MLNKKQRIMDLLLEYPNGLKARQIAEKLPYMDKHEVNHILYSNLSDFTVVDYVWKLSGASAKNLAYNTKYKKKEIDCLCRIYQTPFSETQKLAELDLPDFERAVDHAKELYSKVQSAYGTAGRWYAIVTMPEKAFRQALTHLIAQNKRNSEQRVAQIIKERQEKAQREKARVATVKKPSAPPKKFVYTMVNGKKVYQELDYQIYAVQKPALTEDQNAVRRCTGNCSTCTRDECIENK